MLQPRKTLLQTQKNYIRSEKKEISLTVSGVTTSVSGLTQNNNYGLRVEDHEISLNVPDVANVIAVYESLDNGSVILDKLTFAAGLNLNTSAILGEKIIGQGSGAVAQLVTKTSSTEVEFVYLNSNRFSPSETVLFEESNIRSAINSINKR